MSSKSDRKKKNYEAKKNAPNDPRPLVKGEEPNDPRSEEEARTQFDSPKGVRVLANPSELNATSYTMGTDKFTPVPHIGLPKAPQPPPAPLPNAHLYQEFRIPSIRRRMSAKTAEGQHRFREWRESALRKRKALYKYGEQLLRDAGFKGDWQGRNYCSNCGASFFERVGRKPHGKNMRETLRCRDCGWEFSYVGKAPSLNQAAATRYRCSKWRPVRKTTVTQPNDINRRHQYQLKYNPLRQSRTAIEQQVRNHPDFLVDAARHEIQMTNAPIIDVAEQMGVDYDWLRQRLSRGNQVLGLYQTDPHAASAREIIGNRRDPIPVGFNISVRSNNRVEVSNLGTLTDSPQQYLNALLRLQKKKTKDAVKYERKKAQKNGWSAGQLAAAEQAARARVEETYRPFFERFQREIEGQGNAVTVSP